MSIVLFAHRLCGIAAHVPFCPSPSSWSMLWCLRSCCGTACSSAVQGYASMSTGLWRPSVLWDTSPSVGVSFWNWDLFHPRVSRVVSALFSRALFHCWSSFVFYPFGHVIVEEDGLCTGFLKCLLSFQLFDEVGIKQCTILPWLPHRLQVFCRVFFDVFLYSFSFPTPFTPLCITSEDQAFLLHHGDSSLSHC